MSDLKAFVSDPRFQSRDAATKRAMLLDWGVAEPDIAPLVAYTPGESTSAAQVGVSAAGEATAPQPSILERFNSRLPTAGVTEVPGAISDIASSGILNSLKALGSGVAETVTTPFLPSTAVNQYEALRARGQSVPYSALGSIPLIGPAADVVTQDIYQGKVPEIAGDLVTLGLGAGATSKAKMLETPVPVTPVLSKLRAMGTVGAELGKDIVRGATSPKSAMAAVVGNQIGGPVGAVAGAIINTLAMRRARLAKIEEALQKTRDKGMVEQLKQDYARTKVEIAREEAAAKLAERDTIAAAKTEASILEKSDATKVQLKKQRETASMQSAKAEVKILEDAQKAEAAAQSELQAADAAVEKAGAREMAQALKAQSTAAEKAAKAAEATLKAQEKADKAQISREFRQRRQLDEQAKREAAKAAKETPAPQIDLKAKFEVADPDVPARAEAKIQAGEARKARREADAAMNDPKAVKAMKPVDMKLVHVVLQQAAKDGMTRAQAADMVAEMGLGFSQGKPSKFASQAVDRAIAAGLKFKP